MRSPGGRDRTHSGSAPLPGAVIPEPILVSGDPRPFPPVITVFRDHHCRRSRCDHNRSRFSDHHSRRRRKEDIIQITEENIYSGGVFTVVDDPSGDVGTVTGTSCQYPRNRSSSNQKIIFTAHQLRHICWPLRCLQECREQAR